MGDIKSKLSTKEFSHSNIPVSTILCAIFVILKLANIINWSWWWITSPLWLPILFMISLPILVVVIAAIALLFKYLFK
jgi:hypothetical protein